jgi:hypothetical protein
VNLTHLVQTLQFICMNQSYNSEHFWSNMRKCILTICSYIVCVLHFWFPSIKDCDLLKKIQKITHINMMSSISLNVIFKRINFVIQKKINDADGCSFASHLCLIILNIYKKIIIECWYILILDPNNLYYLFANYYKYIIYLFSIKY